MDTIGTTFDGDTNLVKQLHNQQQQQNLWNQDLVYHISYFQTSKQNFYFKVRGKI